MVRSGSSYCSQSSAALTFGLGGDEIVEALEVEWPNGSKVTLTDIRANQFLSLKENEEAMIARRGR